MKRSVEAGAVLSLLVASGLQAQEFQRYHFKKPVELQLDPTRLAIRDGGAPAGYVQKAGSFQYPLPQWKLVDGQNANMDAGMVRTSVKSIASRGQVGFVSPVFIDDFGGPTVVTQDILIGVKETIPAAQARAIVARYGDVIEEGIGGMPNGYKVRSHSRSGAEVLEQANELARMEEVEFAEPDMIGTGRYGLVPNDPNFQYAWGLHNTGQFAGAVPGMDMGAVEAWDITTGDAAIITVVLDSGIEAAHPDLSGRILTPGFDPTGQGGGGAPVSVCDNHGTPVAGCIVAKINNGVGVVGIAPNTRVASARPYVPNESCNGSFTFQFSWVVDSLSWAQSIGARVTNNSNSYGGTSSGIDAAYQSTYTFGMVHFASAANDGTGTISYPASIPVVNSVASIDNNGSRSSFSNWGAGLDFSAPGRHITTTDRVGANGYSSTSYVFVDGTSFASPYAAGAAALILSHDPSLMPAQVEAIMRATARDLGTAGYDTDFGYGLVRADDAMLAVNGECRLTWEQLSSPYAPSARQAPAVAYDASRGRTVLFGGRVAPDGSLNDTWEWNGSYWRLMANDSGPTDRVYGRMIFDAARNEIIYFGGRRPYSSVYLSETWAWNGVAWTLKSNSGPPPRENFAMAYDSSRGRVVMFGGYGGTYRNDIWEWNGVAWEDKTPPSGAMPVGREGPAMAFDPVRQVCVMHGGLWFSGGSTIGSDTWTWNGADWTQVADGPVPRVQHAMEFDHNLQQVVAFGGNSYGSTFYSDLIAFDGTIWANMDVAEPLRRSDAGLSFDVARSKLVMTSGYVGGGASLSDAWEFDGIRWIPVSGPSPSARFGSGFAYSAQLGGAVMFGGQIGFAQPYSPRSNELWLQSPHGWGRLNSFGPPKRVYPSLGSLANGDLVMFGGLGEFDDGQSDLFRFSNGQWSLLTPSGSPTARWGATSCVFTSTDKFVVFGGQFNGSLVSNTLSVIDLDDPQQWQHHSGSGGPSARDYAMMAYDPVNDEAILFGGRASGGWALDDVWRLRFVAGVPEWTQVSSLGSINGWESGSMFWDPGRQRILLYGKQQFGFEPGAGVEPTVYEWTGAQFVPIALGAPPSLRRNAMMGPTSESGEIRLFGGVSVSDSQILSDAWAFNGVDVPGFPVPPSGGGSYERGSNVELSLSTIVGQSPQLVWKRDGVALADGPTPAGSVISGSQTPTLVIGNIQPADAGFYVCAGSNPCGSAESYGDFVQVTVNCPADFNGDLQVDDSDFVLFAGAYDLLDCADPNMAPGCPADINIDGLVDDLDFVLFASAYDQLICP